MGFNTGKSRLAVLLFLVLSYITVCLSAPTAVNFPSDALSTVTGDSLEKRNSDNLAKWEDMHSEINANSKARVHMNEERFQNLSPSSNMFSSAQFETCIGVVIVSKQGAIIGHYNPDQNMVNQAKTNIPRLYMEHSDQLSEAKAYVYASVYPYEPGTFVNLDLINDVEDMLKNQIKLEPQIVKYTEAGWLAEDENGEIRDCDEFPGQGMFGAVKITGDGTREPHVDFITLQMQLNP